MTVRVATTRDFPGFSRLCDRVRDRLETYPGCPIDLPSLTTTFGKCANSALGLALVAENAGKIDGALLAWAQELWWSRQREAIDILFYAETPGDGPRMLRQMLDWAWSVPRVQVVNLASTFGAGADGVLRLHERLGLKRIGHIAQIVRPAAASAKEVA